MAKIAKHLAVATFFMSLSVFASSEAPTDLDSLFRGKEFQLPRLDSSYRTKYSEASQPKGASKESNELYVLQFDAIVNFDAAQARRAALRTQTGYEIQMVFDAPFYKLRGGSFRKKSEAEDKAREFSLYNISAFVIRIR